MMGKVQVCLEKAGRGRCHRVARIIDKPKEAEVTNEGTGQKDLEANLARHTFHTPQAQQGCVGAFSRLWKGVKLSQLNTSGLLRLLYAQEPRQLNHVSGTLPCGEARQDRCCGVPLVFAGWLCVHYGDRRLSPCRQQGLGARYVRIRSPVCFIYSTNAALPAWLTHFIDCSPLLLGRRSTSSILCLTRPALRGNLSALQIMQRLDSRHISLYISFQTLIP